MLKKLGIIVLVLVIAIAIAWKIGLPLLVQRRAVDDAKERGVALEIESVSVGFGSVTLHRIHATDDGAVPPNVILDAEEATLTLRGWAPNELVIHKPVITMAHGERSLTALASLRQRTSRAPSSSSEPVANASSPLERVVIDDGTATFSGAALLEGARTVVRRIDGELTREPSEGARAQPGSALSLRAEMTMFAGDVSAAGPWAITVRRAAGLDEQLVELNPRAPGSATLRRVVSADGGGRTQVTIKKQRLDALGLPATFLTARAPGATLVDVDIDHLAGTAVRGHATVALSGFTMPGAPVQAPLRASVAYEGPPTAVRVRDGTFAFGPFHGTVSGMLDVSATSPKLHLELISTKTPCEALARSLAEEALPGMGAALSALGLNSAAKGLITGQMGFVANLDVDGASLAAPRFVVRPEGACGVDVPFFSRAQ